MLPTGISSNAAPRESRSPLLSSSSGGVGFTSPGKMSCGQHARQLLGDRDNFLRRDAYCAAPRPQPLPLLVHPLPFVGVAEALAFRALIRDATSGLAMCTLPSGPTWMSSRDISPITSLNEPAIWSSLCHINRRSPMGSVLPLRNGLAEAKLSRQSKRLSGVVHSIVSHPFAITTENHRSTYAPWPVWRGETKSISSSRPQVPVACA
jgi:hypothetical protein